MQNTILKLSIVSLFISEKFIEMSTGAIWKMDLSGSSGDVNAGLVLIESKVDRLLILYYNDM